jgi:hypothetical protein
VRCTVLTAPLLQAPVLGTMWPVMSADGTYVLPALAMHNKCADAWLCVCVRLVVVVRVCVCVWGGGSPADHVQRTVPTKGPSSLLVGMSLA